MLNEIFISLRIVVLTLVLTGIAYPLAVTGISQLIFPYRANGSIVVDAQEKPVGSELLSQPFEKPWYFHGRPSMITFDDKIPVSGGSNWGPDSPKLKERIETERKRLRTENPDAPREIPVELLTTSGSGLDPHLSPEAARWQVARIAKARNVDADRIARLIDDHTESRTFGFLGERRVNVLKLNLAIDEFFGRMTE